MRSHRHAVRRLRRLALGLVAIAVVAPSSALAQPARDAPPSPPQAKVGDTPADFASGARYTALADHYASTAARTGDTPADHPGASRAPEYQAPTTIEVVRPEQTVIRDVDEELPIVLGGLALLVALGGTGFTLVRMRGMQRRLTHGGRALPSSAASMKSRRGDRGNAGPSRISARRRAPGPAGPRRATTQTRAPRPPPARGTRTDARRPRAPVTLAITIAAC